MPPVFKCTEILAIVEKLGWSLRRTKGSHHIYGKYDENGNAKIVSIPVHSKDMPIGTALSILKSIGITIDEAKRLKK